MSEISSRILQLITEKGLSYSDLSKSTGISKSALQRYATGETPKIPLDRLELIASALGVSASYLMGWEEDSEQSKAEADDRDIKVALFGGDSEVTDEMWEEVKQFADFVKAKHLKEKK